MTRLLVSVRNSAEALAALRGGADLIDLKEPQLGSLGAVPTSAWSEIREAIADRVPLSVALGELLEDDCEQRASASQGFQFAKIGLAGTAQRDDWLERWSAAIQRLPSTTQAVAVVYADAEQAQSPAPRTILAAAQQLHCAAILVDTYQKTRGSLLDLWSMAQLTQFRHDAREAGLICVLGGSLHEQHIPRLLPIAPDYIAVRGAVCRGARTATLDPELVASLRQAIPRSQTN